MAHRLILTMTLTVMVTAAGMAAQPARASTSSPSPRTIAGKSLAAMRAIHSLHAEGTIVGTPIGNKQLKLAVTADCSVPPARPVGSKAPFKLPRSRSQVRGNLVGEGQKGVALIPFKGHFVQVGSGQGSVVWERSTRTGKVWKRIVWHSDIDSFSAIPYACPLLQSLHRGGLYGSGLLSPAGATSERKQLDGTDVWHLTIRGQQAGQKLTSEYWIDTTSYRWLKSRISMSTSPGTLRFTFSFSQIDAPVTIPQPKVGALDSRWRWGVAAPRTRDRNSIL